MKNEDIFVSTTTCASMTQNFGQMTRNSDKNLNVNCKRGKPVYAMDVVMF